MKGRRRQRGIALILALLVLIILVLLIGQLSVTTTHDRTIARNAMGELQNEYGITAGYHEAVLRLQADTEQSPDTDALDELWCPPISFTLGAATVDVQITDAERRFDLSALLNEKGEGDPLVVSAFRRLLQVLGHEIMEPPDRILDYIDADTKGIYEAGAKNGPLMNLGELQRIEGLTPELLFGDDQRGPLLSYITLWPRVEGARTPFQINPNTASPVLLQALDPEIVPSLAYAIVEYRTTVGNDGHAARFTKAQDLQSIRGMTREILQRISANLVFKSSIFEIRVTSRVGQVERKQLFVVSRPSGASAAPAILASLREYDFQRMPPPEESP
ncbi:MAG: general secretion pathway protein GspK [Planctomycetes bacterium]|nr:general secretion pathway protein GspK [Planctomycetota bacterium]